MGEVYLAKDTVLGRNVALKLLPALFTTDKDRLRRFLQEAQSTSALNHPNILTIHEVGESDGTHFIATEFIEGGTLRERVSNGPLSLNEALEIASQVADALDAAHEARIVHRDIKPENIMIRKRDGFVKVLDFGLAKLTESRQTRTSSSEMLTQAMVKTDPGIVMGTVYYMSPEQARARVIDERTDIWSLGVVLYEMVTGRLPFWGDNPTDIITAIIRDDPRPLGRYVQNVSAELERIVMKALQKSSEQRYKEVKEMAIDLKSLKQKRDFEAELERSLTPDELRARRGATSGKRKLSSQSGATLIGTSLLSDHAQFPNNLSGVLTPLVGREREITEVQQLLNRDDVRLVTLTGVGGTGKTSLAKAVAQDMLQDFVDGVYFIDLSVITDSQLVIPSIAQPLGIKESGSKALADLLKDYLRGRAMLLVLDNFEQLTEAASEIADLLVIAPKLKVLVTSRAILRLSAEREFALSPLAVPDRDHLPPIDELEEYASIALFVERARLVKPNFALTDENSQAVASICMRLDGLPLAIELAAARIRVLSPSSIHTKLESQLKLLVGGARDLPARQQTMRGAIAWSYDLLDEDERTLFNRFSVFAGSATLEAAESVCSGSGLDNANTAIEVLDGIEALTDKCLLLQKEHAGSQIRFRMLEAVREFAQERLLQSGTADAVRLKHAEFFVALAEEAEPELFGPQQTHWLNRLEEEHDNLRAVLQWSLTHDADKALRLAGAIGLLWTLHSHFAEGRRWLEATLQKGDDAVLRPKALIAVGRLAWLQGDYQSARKFYEESLMLAKETCDKRQIALSSRGLGVVSFLEGDNVAARTFLEESLAIRRELQDKVGIATTLNTLGEVARVEGDYTTARSLYEEAVALARDSGLQEIICANLNNLGAVAFHEGDFVAARASYTEALTIGQDLGHRAGIAISLDGCAALAMQSGEMERSAKLSGAAAALYESIGFELETNERILRERYLAALVAGLDNDVFAAAVEEGRRLKLKGAIELALSESVD